MMLIMMWCTFLLCFDCEKLYEVVDLWWCWYWCEYAKCRLLMVNLYMLNVNIGYGIACIELCCWILICKFDGDSCGACMYERCLFWWCIMLLNYYMQMMVILMVNAYLQNEGGLEYLYPVVWFEYFVFNGLEYLYISNGDDVGELLLNTCIVCHVFMHES